MRPNIDGLNIKEGDDHAKTFDTASSSSSLFRLSFLSARSVSAVLRLPYLSPFSRLSAERTAAGEMNSADALVMSDEVNAARKTDLDSNRPSLR